jgi:C-terminal peptidase prc
MFAGLLGSLVLAMAVALPARAAKAPTQPYVVLVGISKYQDAQILPRPHAEADVKALYDVFTNKDYLGVDADHVRLLLGGKDEQRHSTPATQANILKAINWMAGNAKTDDLVIFAFIGQGAPHGERTCYFASDSTYKGRAKDSVSASEIEKALKKLKSQRFCAFIDVNFKGFNSGKEHAPDLNLLKLYRELIGEEDDTGAYASRVVFLANSGLKPSIDLQDHGIFTHVLLEGLRGKADTEGYEPDGRVTVEELAKYLRKQVSELAKEHGKTDEQKKQKAIILEAQTSNFVLTRNPAVTPVIKKRLARIAELAKDEVISPKLANEGKNLLRQMPKLETQRKLRRVYQKLADGKLEPAEFKKARSALIAKMKLRKGDAREYALTVIKATRVLKAGYVKLLNQGQLVDWGVQGLFRKLEEKVPAELGGRLAKARNLKESELRVLLTDVREYLGKREDLARGKDVTYTLTPMCAHLDKHTDYITPEVIEQLKIDTQGEFYGIGAHIRQNTSREMLQIVTPILGSPAYKAKLYAGDIITKITRLVDNEGNPLKRPITTSTKGMSTEEAVKLIKGVAGTKVKLTVEREGVDHPLEFTITRGRVEVESVLGYKRKTNDLWNYYVEPANKIAYIRLTGFANNTYRDLKAVMKKLSKTGIKGLVLDLRFNPGGLLDSAVRISDMFIDEGKIVTIKPRRGREIVYMGRHEGSYLGFPMVCLINDGSASGSEIVSACLQDHGRAVIMGERSYGKGSVQNIQPFEPTGGKIKLTTASFWRPNGKNLNKSSTPGRDKDEWGVTPDPGYLLKLSIKDQDALFDFQTEQVNIQRPDRKKEKKPDYDDRQLKMALQYLHKQIQITGKGVASRKKAG